MLTVVGADDERLHDGSPLLNARDESPPDLSTLRPGVVPLLVPDTSSDLSDESKSGDRRDAWDAMDAQDPDVLQLGAERSPVQIRPPRLIQKSGVPLAAGQRPSVPCRAMGTRGMLSGARPLVITMAVAPTAGADTFCVDRAGCSDPGHNFTTVQQAISAAEANNPASPPASPDLILVGDGVFHEAVTEGGDNPVDIVGSGPRTEPAALHRRDPGNSVRTVVLGVALGGRASTIKDVTIQVASGADNTGLAIAGEVENVDITAATSPSPPRTAWGSRSTATVRPPSATPRSTCPGSGSAF